MARRYARNRVFDGISAEDLEADLVCFVLSNLHAFDETRAAFSTWAYLMFRKALCRRLEKSARSVQECDGSAIPEVCCGQDVDSEATLNLVLSRLECDPEARRVVILLYEGNSHREVAEQVGASVFRRALKRARSIVAEVIGDA